MDTKGKKCKTRKNEMHAKVSRLIEEAIEKQSRGQNVSRWIEVAIESYQECDKKKLKGLDRQSSCREVSRNYQDCLKQFFKEGKNTCMNAIKYATQPKIQTTF